MASSFPANRFSRTASRMYRIDVWQDSNRIIGVGDFAMPFCFDAGRLKHEFLLMKVHQ